MTLDAVAGEFRRNAFIVGDMHPMTATAEPRVDFFIVGTQKGGTTSLDHHLRQSPGVQMARTKEVHYFDDDRRDWSVPDVHDLHCCFDWRAEPGIVRGEATPIYCYWPHALERLARYNPAARLIMCLRHPAWRAHSHWQMESRRGMETMPFAAAVSELGRRRVTASPSGVHRVFSYVERGFYGMQIRAMQSLFPRCQLHFLRTDRLWDEPDRTVRDLLAFLGVAPTAQPVSRAIVPRVAGSATAVSEATPTEIAALTAVYADDIRLTESLTGVFLSDWLDERYREPMATA